MKNLWDINLIHLILEKLPIVFWTVDRDLVFTSSFGGGLKDLGLEENQVVGLSLFQYFETKDKNYPPIEAHLKALNGEKCEFKLHFKNLTFKAYTEPIYAEQNQITGVIGFAINITEQEKIYEELKVKEEKYRILFDSADDAIFLMDEEIFIDCNQATLKMFNCTKEDIIGQSAYKFSPQTQPDGRLSEEKAKELIRNALNGIPQTFEWVHQKLNGEIFYTEVTLNRVSINDKYFILAIVRDITERKEKDRQIYLLARALESINECVSITDLNNNIIYVNSAYEKIYGYKKEELIGKPIYVLRSEKNTPEMFKDIYSKTLEGGWTGELWNKRKNGEDFLIKLSTSPVYDENKEIIALIGVAIDITEEKKLFNQIKYDAERLKILFENAPDAIFVCDYEGKIVEANRASEELVGWSKEEALGKTFFELNLFDRSNFYKAAKVFYKALKAQPTGPDEIVIRNKHGETIYIEVSTYPIVIEGKKLILCTARNITERKKILFELARAKEEAEKANRTKTLFFAQMSHEIRTPINAILGFSDVLKEIFYETSDKEVRGYFDILQNAANTLLNTINQILDFSRVESGAYKYSLKPISFNKTINEVFEMLKVLAEKKNLKLETELPEEDVIVFADQYTLNGILINLINNAIKYSDKGTIKIRLQKDLNFGICEIKDEGIGMSEEFQRKLFTSFETETSDSKKRKEGTGLGLALTKKYVELNKGEISVKSKKGFGTTVTFKIPLAKINQTS